MDRVIVTKKFVTICHMQVCAVNDATDEEILHVCNRDNLCGTTKGWCEVIRETDDSKFGKENNKAPVACGDDPGRTHFLVSC